MKTFVLDGEERPDYGVRRCCIPDCSTRLPRTHELPVCHSCGVKIAVAHLHDATRVDAVNAEIHRRRATRRADQHHGRTADACVYYVRLDDQRIKIGFTSHLKRRLSQLRVDHDALLAIEPGGRDVEQQRHQAFTADRIHRGREDFRPSPELLAWINQLRATHALPHWTTVPVTTRVNRRAG